MAALTLSFFDIIFLFLCAVILGAVIHFFISSRRQLNKMMKEGIKPANGMDEWKLKYLNDMEIKNKIIEDLNLSIKDSEENEQINQIEIEELKIRIKDLTNLIDNINAAPKTDKQPAEKTDYFEQLQITRENLAEQNKKISQLLEQMDSVQETEEKISLLNQERDSLNTELNDLRYLLSEKEAEIRDIKEKASLSGEMTSMLDNAYHEFNTMQGKILKLESQLSGFKLSSLELENLKESNYKLTKEQAELEQKLDHYKSTNQQLESDLEKTEKKLNEANQQRQQLQKKVAYLEELTNDLQLMAETNKNLESKLKKIGELESMLHVVSEERNILRKKQQG